MQPDLLTEIYSSFDPFQPPRPEAYVDCEAVRGGWDVLRELGRKITRSNSPTCQLYTGHRGVGKSTELLRLKVDLERQQYKVVYFAAEQYIEPNDDNTEYADILFACTRCLLREVVLKDNNPLLRWMKNFGDSLKELLQTEIAFDQLTIEGQLAQVAKLGAVFKAVPDRRREIRRRINDYTPSLVDALNEFIELAQGVLPTDCRGIVIMADNLDRIVERKREGELSNYDEIYLNRSGLLKGLQCHVIYTVPISMIYSERRARLTDDYDTDILPMVMMRQPDGKPNWDGIYKFRQIITKRLNLIDPNLETVIESQVFEDRQTLHYLCAMSGGHLRVLMQLIQKSIDWIDTLPITARAVQRAIDGERDIYRTTIQDNQWRVLAEASASKQLNNNEQCLRLLFNRCLLEYRYYDDKGKLQCWRDIHPLIEEIDQFKTARRQWLAQPPDPSSP